MKVKSESEVAQLCLTLRNPMDCSPPGSSVHGIFQARVLERGAIAFSDLYITICKTDSLREASEQYKELSSVPCLRGVGWGWLGGRFKREQIYVYIHS